MAGIHRIVNVFRSNSNVDELAVHQRCKRTNSVDSGCVTEGDAAAVTMSSAEGESEDFSEGNIDVFQMNGYRREGQAGGKASALSDQDIQDRLSNESGVVCVESGGEGKGSNPPGKSSHSPSRNVSFSNIHQKHHYDATEYPPQSGEDDNRKLVSVCDRCNLNIPPIRDDNDSLSATDQGIPQGTTLPKCVCEQNDCETHSSGTNREQDNTSVCRKCQCDSCQCSEHSSPTSSGSSETTIRNTNSKTEALSDSSQSLHTEQTYNVTTTQLSQTAAASTTTSTSQTRRGRLDPKKLELSLSSGPKHNTIPEEPSSCSPTADSVDTGEKAETEGCSVVVKLEPVQESHASRQSWLLRLFQSKLFDMSIAITYLFNSKEPGVQSYIGKLDNFCNIYTYIVQLFQCTESVK